MNKKLNKNASSILEAIKKDNIDFFTSDFIPWFKWYRKNIINNLDSYSGYNEFLECVMLASKKNSKKVMKYFFENQEITQLFAAYPYGEKEFEWALSNAFLHNNESLAKVIFNAHSRGKKVFSQMIPESSINKNYENDTLFYYIWYQLASERNRQFAKIVEDCQEIFKEKNFEDSILELHNILKGDVFKNFPFQYETFLHLFLNSAVKDDNVQLVSYLLTYKNFKYNPNCLKNNQQVFNTACYNNSLDCIDLILNNLHDTYIINNDYKDFELNNEGFIFLCSNNNVELIEKILNNSYIKTIASSCIDFEQALQYTCNHFNKEIIPLLLKASLHVSQSKEINSILLNNYPHWTILGSFQFDNNNTTKEYQVVDIMNYIFTEPLLNPETYSHKVEYNTQELSQLLFNYVEKGSIEVIDYLLFSSPDNIKNLLTEYINENLIEKVFDSFFLPEKGKSMLNYFIYDLNIPHSPYLKKYFESIIENKNSNFYEKNKAFAQYAIEQYELLHFKEQLYNKVDNLALKNINKKKKI